MTSLTHIVTHVTRYGKSHSSLYYFLPVIFFWGIFDTIVSYISPIVLNSNGYSIFAVGCLIGTSSIWGAGLDFILSKYSKKKSYLFYFKYLFITCAIVPIFFYFGEKIAAFLVVMALWGLYYDLYNFGIFEFIGHTVEKEANVSSFGLVSIMRSLAMAITPIILGFVLVDKFNVQTMWLMYACIAIGVLVFITHSMSYKPNVASEPELHTPKKRISLLEELKLWFKVEKFIHPVLILITFLNIIDAFFWTLGPLISENLKPIHPLGGLFLTAYIVPSLFIGPLAATISRKFGKKKTAFYSLMISSFLLLCIFVVKNPLWLITIVFFASLFNSIAWPSIKGAIADYIQETPRGVSELEGLQDFSTNIGYVIGPILAGLTATYFNRINAFGVIGIVGIILSIILIHSTPKKIRVRI